MYFVKDVYYFHFYSFYCKQFYSTNVQVPFLNIKFAKDTILIAQIGKNIQDLRAFIQPR